jgi:RNA polymerase sigma-70 factor (ECF subfamily)
MLHSEEPAPLLPRVALGDELAMRECLRRYGGLLYSIVRRFCRDPADADDACQDVFVSVWRAATHFDPARGRESTFVALVARRRMIDRMRSAHGPGPEGELTVTAAEVLDRYVDARTAAAALDACTDDQRRVITRVAAFGLTHEEVSKELGMPLGSVKSHYARGIERVRRALFDKDKP